LEFAVSFDQTESSAILITLYERYTYDNIRDKSSINHGLNNMHILYE